MSQYKINTNNDDICKELLKEAQLGNTIAEEELIVMLRDNYMMRRISRYINRNRQVDNEDLKQEFLIGIAIGIPKADMTIGNPIEYLITQGMYRVKSYFRKCVIQNTIQYCKDCGDNHRMNLINGNYICKKCGSMNVSVTETNNHDETLLISMFGGEFEQYVVSEMIASTFKDTLQPGTRTYELYELMVEQEINKTNPNIKNYIQELANMMGGCSTSNVLKNLNKLKDRYNIWESNIKMG